LFGIRAVSNVLDPLSILLAFKEPVLNGKSRLVENKDVVSEFLELGLLL
jgi:hypothetical protein